MRLVSLILTTLFLTVGCRTVEKQNAGGDASIKSNDSSSKTYDEVISFLEVTASPAGDAYKIILKSELEIFCETLCSRFALVEDQCAGDVTYKATRTPIKGNVIPSRLIEERNLTGVGSDFKKVIVKNLGKNGNDIDLTQATKNGRTHFFATMARLTRGMAIGGESAGYRIKFGDSEMDAAVDDQSVAAQLAAASSEGFVTGYVVTESKIERGDISVFHVLSYDKSISF